jgi:hypothetical protein
MPRKINMFLSNGNHSSPINLKQIKIDNLAHNPSMSTPKANLGLNESILARVHNVRPGCGSCGRH